MKNPDIVERPLAVGTTEARRLLGCGKTKLWEILPELDSFSLGRKRMITRASIEAFIAKHLAEQQKKAA